MQNVIPLTESKICKSCSQSKLLADFPHRKGRPFKDATCIQCRAIKARESARKRKLKLTDPANAHLTKFCRICGEKKQWLEFSPSNGGNMCKSCYREYDKLYRHRTPEAIEKRNAQKRGRLKSDPTIWIRHHLKKNYGLTLEQRNLMYENQGGRCKICQVHQMDITHTLCVDHCHSTGKVRGLLCNRCNHALGSVDDNIERLEIMIQYLKDNQ